MVSIIIPVYKVEQYLSRCIDSVLRQGYTDYEVILVDDGSPDNCGVICDQYAKADPRIKVVHKENGGLSSARNAGIEICRGKYLTFLDSDDYWRDDYLEIMVRLLEQYDADIVQCGYLSGEEGCFPTKGISEDIAVFNKYTALEDYRYLVIAWGKLYKREVIGDIRFPVGKINEDDATYYRFADRASKIIATTTSLYYYYQTQNSIMRHTSNYLKEDFIDVYEERIRYFEEKGDKRLTEDSHVRYCMVLMLFYMACRKNRDNQNDTEKIRALFVKEYAVAKKAEHIPGKLKLFLTLFYRFPRTSTFFGNLLRSK